MIRYLVVLIWPAGMAVIFGVAFLAWRRNVVMSAAAASHSASHSGPQPGRHHSRRAGGRSAFSEAVGGSARFGVMAVVGAIVVFGVMALLGLLVVYHGLAIDRPVFKWLSSHQVHAAAAAMNQLTKIGDTWTAWGAAIAAAGSLAVTWRDKRWLPPVALGSLSVIDHYTTLALRHGLHRLGPPPRPPRTPPSRRLRPLLVFLRPCGLLPRREVDA